MRFTLNAVAWTLKLYAALAKVWPLSLIIFAWYILGTPYLLTDEKQLSGRYGWSCTYRALWDEETWEQADPCLPFVILRG